MSANSFDHEYAASPYMGPLRARPLGALAAFGMGAGASLILAAAVILTRHAADPQSVANADAPAAAAAPAAKIANKIAAAGPDQAGDARATPFSAFDLNAPEFEREKKVVSVRESEEGGGRVDSLTMGQFAMGAPLLRIDIHQNLTARDTNPDFFLDMTRHAAQLGLNVAKIGQPTALTTRFGAFEAADIRLTQPASEGVAASERSCLATRLVDGKLPLEIAGLACGAATLPIERASLGCMLDRLEYVAPGDNKALNEFFLNAEAARGKGCANVSRDDVTASIPARKPPAKRAARAKPVVHKTQAAR